jgi:hypothetical protein
MSPRGFYSKEFITPYFTSDRYINSDEGKEAMDEYLSIENKIKAILKYPQKIWLKILTAIGFLESPK